MSAMWMVQVAVHKVVDVITVRHRFVAAIEAMNVARRMTIAGMAHGTMVRVRTADGNSVLLVVVTLVVMQVAVVQVVDVIAMPNGDMSASGAVDMKMSALGVNLMGHNELPLPSSPELLFAAVRRRVRAR